MPTVSRAVDVEAPRERVWELVSDPYMLPRWWPRAQRVEEVTDDAWTVVLLSDRGKPIRADYTRAGFRPPERMEWRQELEETPFERMLSEARVVIEVSPRDAALTTVKITSIERLRGLARLGRFWVRRAAGERLDEALERLELAVGDA